MPAFSCRTCAVQYAPGDAPPAACTICEDERQYVPATGQRWVTQAELAAEGHRCDVREVEPGLLGIGVVPSLGIGQRALVVAGPDGALLWDPPGYLDEAALAAVRDLGGLAAVSASHPHFYGAMVEWSLAFGGVPVLVPAADEKWITRPDPVVRLYEDVAEVAAGVTLVRCGGHFPGSAVVHWAGGAEGRGALLTGDTIMVVRDPGWVTFMRSYPNQIPLPGSSVREIAARVDPYRYDRLYGGWWDTVVPTGAAAAVARSADRYVRWVDGAADPGV